MQQHKKVQLTAVQMTSLPEPQQNLKIIEQLLQQLPAARPQLVVLPEACLCFGAGDKQQRSYAELYSETAPLQAQLAQLAAQHGIYLLVGTMPIVDDQTAEKFSAASLLFGPDGKCLARYNKIHLFDVDVADNTKTYRESKWTEAGQEVVTVATEFGTLGLAVCYDVRFPELFRALRDKGAAIIALPSAFTKVTGAAHWQVLTRARAIEQQCFVVAGAQVGTHANGRETYGHALIIDGWGNVVSECDGVTSPCLATASVELDSLQPIRSNIPVAKHFARSKKVIHE
ncbi:carbon-nitrogen hydrolase family protein [Pseudidiomarina sp. CB1]|uniref:carbon-nitrogen hydrolase family protein n=1 Tax=Pseudidiomarina sp. CB1 TaxID=2972484 RepID=UPI002162E7D7|nr:carbon-nitrogen hydrolase family protein [Pseudidiomarina sp. CB1]